jgi:hypothetical protein
VNFSFKLMRREVLDAVQLRSEGSLVDAELIVKARTRGFIIQQIGLDYFPRVMGTSNLSSPTVIFKIFKELVELFPDMRKRIPRVAPMPVAESSAGAPVDESRGRLSST